MVDSSIDWIKMSDAAVVKQIAAFIKHTRLQQNVTQAKLAEMAGLNRWTISNVEKGESLTITTLIQILRALDILYVLNDFKINDEISPIEYAKLQEKKRQRARAKGIEKDQNEDLGW